jgi:hypothetical protein
MTVTSAEARIEYAGNGTTKVFAYPYQFYQNSDLEVWLFNDTTGEGTLQLVGINYTVTGAMNPTGGNLTFTVAPPAGYTLIIINNPDIVQVTHYVNADDFPADSHEQALDRLTKICQRLSDRIDRAVKAPDYAPEDQVPDADTLVNLVEDAQDAAAEAAISETNAAASAATATTGATTATNAANAAGASAQSAAVSATSATNSANSATNSAAAAANSAHDAQVAEVEWKGNWSASVQYVLHDAVFFSGSSYICLIDNINSQPDTHPTQWGLLAQQGAPGAGGGGTGDMVRANNLNDVISVTQSRINLGLGTSATHDIGTTANTVAAGDDPRFTAVGMAFTPTGNVASTNIQAAIAEVDSEKVAKAGDTITGTLTLNPPAGGGALVISGAGTASIEIGRVDGVASTPIIDFHSGATAIDYDVRLMATGSGAASFMAVYATGGFGGSAVATAAEYTANSAPNKMLTPGAAWAAAAPVVAGSASALAPDMNAAIDFVWQINSASGALNNPTNAKPGQKGTIIITPQAAGCAITTWGNAYRFPGGTKPTITNTSGAIDIISYTVFNSGIIFCTFQAGFA